MLSRNLPPFELFWYDGGMKPVITDAMNLGNEVLKAEGMMFVGDKGKIIAGFRGEKPVLYADTIVQAPDIPAGQAEQDSNSVWIDAFKNNTQSPGSFIYAGPVTETILLGAVALRAGKKVEYDSSAMKITNIPEADKYLVRDISSGMGTIIYIIRSEKNKGPIVGPLFYLFNRNEAYFLS